MPKAKQDKYIQILSDVIGAMLDGEKVILETTRYKISEESNSKTVQSMPQIPTEAGKKTGGGIGLTPENVLGAISYKIGKNISVKRDRNKRYIVRTPNGELKLPDHYNTDIFSIFVQLGRLYAGESIKVVRENLVNTLKTPDLVDFVCGKKLKKTDTKSKYEAAIAQLKQLGVQPKRLAAYIEKKSSQNG